MSQKKNKQARARDRLARAMDRNGPVDAMPGVTAENTLMGGLKLGRRAFGMVIKRPFASLPMLLGTLLLWLPLAALLANVMALALFGDGPGRELGLQFGLIVSMWLLTPVIAVIVVETAFLMSQRGRVRWRVALACFRCENGLAWLIATSLFLGLATQAGSVMATKLSSPEVVLAIALALLVIGLLVRIVIFLAATHLWSGEPGGRKAIAWAVRSIPRVAIAWASAMMVMLLAILLMLAIILVMGWLVLVSDAWGSGVQVALSIFVMWPLLLMAIGAIMVMEGRIMLELHALALARTQTQNDPGLAEA